MSDADKLRIPMRLTAALLALVLMLTMLGRPPVQRTQEARVLETAREMLGKGPHDWIIPHINGEVRLEKPPLAYWLAAAAFEIGGVSEGIGRVPFALAGWVTLIVTCLAARWVVGERGGILAGGVLLGMWIFARHARLAETDILATLFVTCATYCIWRGGMFRLGLSGLFIGAAAMGKGLPAAFPIIFLLLLAWSNHDRSILWRWTLSGAPLIAVAIGAPWFIYAGITVGTDKFTLETRKGLFGLQHAASFLQYFPDLLKAALPWTPATLVAIFFAARASRRDWRGDWRARGLLLWFGSIFVPLLIAGQRQFHYLFPAMPALAVMVAWMIEESARDEKLTRVVLLGSRRPILVALIAAVVMTLVSQAWIPSRQASDPRTISAQIRAIGSGPYCFYGENISLPLLFYLGQQMRRVSTSQDLTVLIDRSPSMIVIAQSKSGVAPPPVPTTLRRVAEIPSDSQLFEIYQADR